MQARTSKETPKLQYIGEGSSSIGYWGALLQLKLHRFSWCGWFKGKTLEAGGLCISFWKLFVLFTPPWPCPSTSHVYGHPPITNISKFCRLLLPLHSSISSSKLLLLPHLLLFSFVSLRVYLLPFSRLTSQSTTPPSQQQPPTANKLI